MCKICENLIACALKLDKTIYNDANGSMVMTMRLEQDPSAEDGWRRNYMLIEGHNVEGEVKAHKVSIRFCPFCGKELV